MADRYERRLLEHLGHDSYQPKPIPELAAELGVPAAELDLFAVTVRRLRDEGRVALDGNQRVLLPTIGAEIVGRFRKHIRGFGFVIPETPVKEGDVFIPADATADALTGDTVRVQVRRRGEELSGRIVEVLARKRKVFTGELVKRGGIEPDLPHRPGATSRPGSTQWLVFPDGRELTQPIVVRDPSAKNARHGDKVVVEITAYPEGSMLAEGVITQVLGEAGLPSVETQAVIAAYNLPGEFPERAYAQARRAADAFQRELEEGEAAGWTDREDLRQSRFIITIDPPDAKDYDDAIHIERTPEGWDLGVHIADVAHFIPPGTPLDEEARRRGNSVYLPRHVIPMLPEVLSNGICSLQEGVPRFCKSAFMSYDRRGGLIRSGVAQTLICSAKRLTYLEAQALIDGDLDEARRHARTEPNYTDQLLQTLREMDACARAIRERRRAAGMIHLELPEVELIFDDEGHVIDAEREDDAFTHTIIEMFMVEANEVLARLFERLDVPLLRRVHPEPTPGDVEDLRDVARVAGFTIPKRPTRQELQALLDATRGTPAAPAVHFAVLRTLTRAEYSPALIGHFALASEAYAHFTSPIRRYPDLTVHRALSAYLALTANGSRPPRTDEERDRLGQRLRQSPLCPDIDTLTRIGKACSLTEEIAAEAEESLRSFLVLQLLSEHVGEEFSAMVTGCTNAGVFVKLDKYLAEGLIKTEDLPPGGPPVEEPVAASPEPGAARDEPELLRRVGQRHARPERAPGHGPGFRGNRPRPSGAWKIDQRSGRMVHLASGRSYGVGDRLTVVITGINLALRRMDLAVADPLARDTGKRRKVYPKPGVHARATPHGPAPVGGLGPVGGGLNLDWEAIKRGQSGATRRSRRSKQRSRGKNHRRDR
jgi:ribonuclease R